VWYTDTSFVGLKSYRHLFLADCYTGAVHEIWSVDHQKKSSKLVRPDAFPKRKIFQKCVCGPTGGAYRL